MGTLITVHDERRSLSNLRYQTEAESDFMSDIGLNFYHW
jgi:hypothetical protein